MKSSLVGFRTFQLVLHLSGSVQLSTGSLQNIPAFQALLCDLEVGIHILTLSEIIFIQIKVFFSKGFILFYLGINYTVFISHFQVWQNMPDNLDLSVLKHFAEILQSPR